MNKLKLLFKILASVVVLMIVLVLALAFVADPNQYKPAIVDAVRDSTGLELNIAGDLSLSFQPFIGVSLNDVRLRNPGKPQELASSTRISLRVDALSLIRGPLLIQELLADDFHINWFTDADGVNLWSASTSQPGATTTNQSNEGLSANIALISISNASVDIQNLQQNTHYTLQGLDLVSRNSNVENRSFPLEASFELVDHTTPRPLPFTFTSNNRVDLDRGNIRIQDIQLVLTPMQLQGSFEILDFNEAMTFRGELASNSFSVEDLLGHFSATERTGELTLPGTGTDSSLSQQATVQIRFNGDTTNARIPQIRITLDNTLIEAEASVRFANELSPTNISYEVESNTVDLNRLLRTQAVEVTSTTADESDAGSNSISAAPIPVQPWEIPREFFTGMNVQGSISIESLIYDQFRLEGVNIFTNLENGVLDIEAQPAIFLEGSLAGNIRVNSVPQDSELFVQLSSRDINIADLTLPMFELDAITGRLNLEMDYHSSGKTLRAWQDNLSGTTSFSVDDNSVDIGVIKQVFTSIAALSPDGGAIQQWPDILRFNEFAGYAIFDNGVEENQQVKVRMDNFDITGTGGFNPDEGSFDYSFSFTILGEPFLQTIAISERYHNVAWPVRCTASFDTVVNQFCRPDLTQVRQLFMQLGGDEIQRRLQDVLTDQVPAELQDSARGLLRNLFPDRQQ